VTTNPRRILSAAAAGLAAVALVAGCGGPPRAKVRGAVSLDGKALAKGTIEFFPTGPGGQSAAAVIADGTYEAEASPGEMRVTVYSTEVTGRQKAYNTPDSPVVETVRNVIPERYNTKSELKASLVAGPNEVSFDLTSDRKK
jgi:hypothetical protein